LTVHFGIVISFSFILHSVDFDDQCFFQ